jgi:DNA polymerase-3 subunit delta'
MPFQDAIIGNEQIVNMLGRSYKFGKLSHAYLFDGPEHIGKKTLALAFCKLILQNGSTRARLPDGQEYGANNIEENPDLVVLRPDEDKKQIIIEQIRDLQKKLSLFPYSAKYKVAIIEQADMMSKSAANSILKTLEEPSSTTILILLTSNSGNLLDTIKSRCQTLKFLPVKRRVLEDFVKNKISDQSKVEEIIELSGYKPGKIVELASNRGKIEELIGIMDRFSNFVQKSDAERLDEAEIVSKKEMNEIVDLLNLYSFYFRKVLLKEYSEINETDKDKVIKIKNNINLINNTKENLLTKNINAKLALENLFLQL